MNRIRINDKGHLVVYLGEHLGEVEIPSPGYKVKAPLLESAQKTQKAAMRYFLIHELKLPDDKLTERIGNAFLRRGVTPEMILLADLTKLKPHVRNLGVKGVEILERAIRNYK
jgi:hypothetical protein